MMQWDISSPAERLYSIWLACGRSTIHAKKSHIAWTGSVFAPGYRCNALNVGRSECGQANGGVLPEGVAWCRTPATLLFPETGQGGACFHWHVG